MLVKETNTGAFVNSLDRNGDLISLYDIVDLVESQSDDLWKADPEPDLEHCFLCRKKLIRVGVPPGRLICPVHSTRGVPA